MKSFRILCVCMFLFCLLLSGCRPTVNDIISKQEKTEEIRAVWISYMELTMSKEVSSKETFQAMASEMVEQIRASGMNTIFLHVRPFSDALYRSSVFPYSACLSGTEGFDPGYDALEIFCAYAQKAGISVHAWINPFRIGKASEMDRRSDDNPAKRILNDGNSENDSRVVNVDGTLYYDPANHDNKTLILDGVRELLANYPIDGIHIDDYFYPSTESYIDQIEYDDYLANGGTLLREDWRRVQINTLVSRIYTCVKSFGINKIFSISPALDIESNRTTLYADVVRWASFDGYCDWLIPQAYVGFLHETNPFAETINQWQAIERSPNVRLLFGLAAYKCGVEDPYAGSGRDEWIKQHDILSRQIQVLRNTEDCAGFALFSYSYIFGGKMSNNSVLEMKSVISML